MFEVCPICGATSRVRLLPDWQERVNVRHEPIPIVGCGNPWHYDGWEPTVQEAEDVERAIEAGEAEAREAYLRPIAKGGQPRPVIPCDNECGAPLEPVTRDEFRAAMEHYRDHPYLHGCSHAR